MRSEWFFSGAIWTALFLGAVFFYLSHTRFTWIDAHHVPAEIQMAGKAYSITEIKKDSCHSLGYLPAWAKKGRK